MTSSALEEIIAVLGAPAAGKEGVFSRHALDQSSLFAGLSPNKELFNKTAPRARVFHPKPGSGFTACRGRSFRR